MRMTVVLFAGILCPALLPAQPRTLTLDEAVRFALEQNINVVQVQNNREAVESQVKSAWGEYLPSLSATGNWTRTQSEQAGYQDFINGIPVTVPESKRTGNNFSAGVSAGVTVFDFLRRESTLGAAKARSEAATHTVTRTRQGVVFQVVSDYLNILRTEQLVLVAEENLKRDQRQLERIVESNRVGALSLADVYRQQSQVSSDELSVISATNNYRKAKVDLLALIGMDATVEVDFVDPTIPRTIDSLEMDQLRRGYSGLEPLNTRALAARPDYLGAQQNLQAAKEGVTIARSGYFPWIDAFGSYNMRNETLANLSDNRNLSWGLGLRWNLFDGFLRDQQIQSAIVSRRNAEIELAQTGRNVTVEVKKAVLDLDAAMKALEVTDDALVSAGEDRKIAEERYNLGAGTLLDLLVANASYVNAQANKVNAVYGYLTAKYNLDFVLGERIY